MCCRLRHCWRCLPTAPLLAMPSVLSSACPAFCIAPGVPLPPAPVLAAPAQRHALPTAPRLQEPCSSLPFFCGRPLRRRAVLCLPLKPAELPCPLVSCPRSCTAVLQRQPPYPHALTTRLNPSPYAAEPVAEVKAEAPAEAEAEAPAAEAPAAEYYSTADPRLSAGEVKEVRLVCTSLDIFFVSTFFSRSFLLHLRCLRILSASFRLDLLRSRCCCARPRVLLHCR